MAPCKLKIAVMKDPRFDKLADLLVGHSTRLEPGEVVLIEAIDIPTPMLTALIEAVKKKDAIPLLERKDQKLFRDLLKGDNLQAVEARMKRNGQVELARMKECQAYIALRGSENITELADVSPEAMKLYEEHWLKPVHLEQRVNHTKWCVLRWPTSSMAQQAGRSTESFEDFYFQVCLVDYPAMARAVKPLQSLMDRTDKVRITGPGTDLSFSIDGIRSVPCTGTHNVPDGECFSAPIRDSVQGTIHFNTPTIYRGTPFDDIELSFENGKVVKSSCNNDEALEKILNSDEGARYFGEFAVAFHPSIIDPMRDILFDEKIRGSVHLALGECYKETENGNRSNVHWDLVLRQEGNGGELWFDDTLVRKDGLFVVDELKGLNPQALL